MASSLLGYGGWCNRGHVQSVWDNVEANGSSSGVSCCRAISSPRLGEKLIARGQPKVVGGGETGSDDEQRGADLHGGGGAEGVISLIPIKQHINGDNFHWTIFYPFFDCICESPKSFTPLSLLSLWNTV